MLCPIASAPQKQRIDSPATAAQEIRPRPSSARQPKEDRNALAACSCRARAVCRMPPGTLSWHPTLTSNTGNTHEQPSLTGAENATTLWDVAGYKGAALAPAAPGTRPALPADPAPSPLQPGRGCATAGAAWGRPGRVPSPAHRALHAPPPQQQSPPRPTCAGSATRTPRGPRATLSACPCGPPAALRAPPPCATTQPRRRLHPDLPADRPQHGPAPGASQAGAPRQRLPPGRLRRPPRCQARPPRRPRSAAAAPQTGSCIRSPGWRAAPRPGRARAAARARRVARAPLA